MKLLTALPTFFDSQGELDLPTQRRHTAWLNADVDGAFVCGTTGEFPALQVEERVRVAQTVAEELGVERTVVHVGSTSVRESATLIRVLAGVGMTRFAAITPYFLPAGPDQVLRYYMALREAAGDHELFAYIFPDRTGVSVDPEGLGRIVEAAGLTGVKLSGAASAQVAEVVAAVPDGVQVYSGADGDALHVAESGGAGLVSGVSSAFPTELSAVVAALNAGGPGTDDEQAAVQAAVTAVAGSITRIKRVTARRGFGLPDLRMADDTTEAEPAGLLALLDGAGAQAGA